LEHKERFMQTPDDPEKRRPEPTPPDPLRQETGLVKPSESSKINLSAAFQLFKQWMASLVIPVPVTLAAFVLAAFLIYPALMGLTSGSVIRQLEQRNDELQKTLDTMKAQRLQLERELSEREVRLSQRQQAGREIGDSGIYISPLLFLEPKKGRTPDLININFSQAEQAILVFSLPRYELQVLEISIYEDTRLVWNQSIGVPRDKLFNQNLVTLLLTRSSLAPGTYRITVEGDPTSRRVALNQFDLTIEG
jgi:hypothetical protein